MEAPKPKAPVKKEVVITTKKAVKKPFIHQPHMVQRPFIDDRLIQLKNRLRKPKFKTF